MTKWRQWWSDNTYDVIESQDTDGDDDTDVIDIDEEEDWMDYKRLGW